MIFIEKIIKCTLPHPLPCQVLRPLSSKERKTVLTSFLGYNTVTPKLKMKSSFEIAVNFTYTIQHCIPEGTT